MPFAIEQDREAIRAGFEIQCRSELIDVKLIDCSFDAPEQEDLISPFSLEMNPQAQKKSFQDGRLEIQVEFLFQATDASDPRKTVFSLESGYLLTYMIQGDFNPTDEQVEAFKDGNAVFNVWPYAREFTQNLTMRAGLPLPPIPLLRLMPKSEEAGALTTPRDEDPKTVNKPSKTSTKKKLKKQL